MEYMNDVEGLKYNPVSEIVATAEASHTHKNRN